MSSTLLANLFLGLPDKSPTLRREYTASPTERCICTPQTSHGFIPLGSTTPLPTPANSSSRPSSIDYFSLPRIESVMSPDAVVYEPHGFIPLCSVAPEAIDDEAGDYFSHVMTKKNHDNQPSHNIAEEANTCSAESRTNTSNFCSESSTPKHKSDSHSSTPTPRFHDSTDTIIIQTDELIHPTGSPAQDRDIVPFSNKLWKPSRPIRPKLRGGGVYDPFENMTELERQRCILSRNPIHDALDRLENHDECLSRAVAALEDAVSKLEEAMVQHCRALERAPSPASIPSINSGSLNSCKETKVEFLMMGSHSEADLTCDEESTIRGSDTDSDDDTFHTAPSHPHSKPEKCHSPTAYKAAALYNSLFRSSPLRPPRTPNAPQIITRPPTSSRVIPISTLTPTPSLATTSHPSHPPPHPLNTLRIIPVSTLTPTTSLATTIATYSHPHSQPLTLHAIASRTSPRLLSSLLTGPKVTLINSSTRKAYVSAPVGMLLHFCGEEAISRRLPTSHTSTSRDDDVDVLEIPATEVEHGGITRVIRFMKRCCLPTSHASISGEMRIPQSDLSAGIETIRACTVLGLIADAARIENLIAQVWLSESISPEDIETLWTAYHGTLQNSILGDAVVWYVLTEMAGNEDGLREVLMWMLELEEFAGLKERVRQEVGGRKWRGEEREGFLRRVGRERRGEVDEAGKKVRGRRKLKKEGKSSRFGKTTIEGTGSEVSSSISGLSAKHVYAEHARSLTPVLVTIPPRQGIRKTSTIVSTSSTSLPIKLGRGSPKVWAGSLDDLGPRKKRSLWEKFIPKG